MLLALALFASAAWFLSAGRRNDRLYALSLGSVEASLDIKGPGSISVVVDPPGRSMLRPGGELEILIFRDKVPVDPLLSLGSGKLRITDGTGHLSLEEAFDQLGTTTTSSNRQACYIADFDTSKGGPYKVEFEFKDLPPKLIGTSLKLIASHEVCGQEALLQVIQYGLALLTGVLGLGSGTWAMLTKAPRPTA